MKAIASYMLFLFTAVLVIVYVIYSTYVHQQMTEKELMIEEACKSYLDIVSDKGAVTSRDYDIFLTKLGATGASYKVSLTVKRLYAIPTTSPLSWGTDSGFTKDYRPAYGFSSDEANFPTSTDPVYLKKFDIITLSVQQTSMMSYQKVMLSQTKLTPSLREWNFARGVRNSGSNVVNNEAPPIPYDNLP